MFYELMHVRLIAVIVTDAANIKIGELNTFFSR